MVKHLLTIGGSDTWGGGGIQTDLKTFENLQVFGLSALTCLAFDKEQQFFIETLDASLVEAQLKTIEQSFSLDGVKIGLLGSLETIQVVRAFCERHQGEFPIVLDPVMAFKESDQQAIQAYVEQIKTLIPLATIVTPNLAEMHLLLNHSPLQTVHDMEQASQQFVAEFQTGVFLKGGRHIDNQVAIDLYCDPTQMKHFQGPLSQKTTIHGAGCCLSSAIASHLALGYPLLESLLVSKRFVYEAIEQGLPVGQAGNVWHPKNN